MRKLARHRAAQAPEVLRTTAAHAYASRWWALLSVAVLKVVLDGALRPAGADLTDAADSVEDPPLADVLDLGRP